MVCLLTPLGRFTVSGMILLAGTAQSLAQPAAVRDTDVDELIEHLVIILKDRQNVFASIRITGPIRIVATGETVEVTDETYRTASPNIGSSEERTLELKGKEAPILAHLLITEGQPDPAGDPSSSA